MPPPFFLQPQDHRPSDNRCKHWAARPCRMRPEHYSDLSGGSPRRLQFQDFHTAWQDLQEI